MLFDFCTKVSLLHEYEFLQISKLTPIDVLYHAWFFLLVLLIGISGMKHVLIVYYIRFNILLVFLKFEF